MALICACLGHKVLIFVHFNLSVGLFEQWMALPGLNKFYPGNFFLFVCLFHIVLPSQTAWYILANNGLLIRDK